MGSLKEKLRHLPDKPGVYQMLAEDGTVLYVGKASSLRSRVRSYFRPQGASLKVAAMVRHIADLDLIITDNEVEALILECNLIKKHRPKYNVFLKDDKTYPYIKITLDETYPRIVTTRTIKKDGAKYFGPYTSAGSLQETIRLLRTIFPVRTCRNLQRQERACLNHHIKKCLAPCAGEVSQQEYREMIQEIIHFLEGKQELLLKNLKEKMATAAAALAYEKAGEFRDQIRAVETVLEKQKMVQGQEDNQDVVGFARAETRACFQVFFIRNGKVIGREHFLLEGADNLTEQELMSIFLKQYYSRTADIPKKVLLQVDAEEQDVIAAWLREKKGSKVWLSVPRVGEKRRLVEMVARNAQLLLEEQRLHQERKGGAQDSKAVYEKALGQLREELALSQTPQRIECYDISTIQGSSTVGSMVVFYGGKPQSSEYRRFRIRTVEGANDYASLQEVLYRRFKRGAGAEKLPDLVLIDGGKGQLSAAREVMKHLGFGAIPTYGLAKREELLYLEGVQEPIRLPEHSEALYLVKKIRDEAHRFAITYHRELRSRESFRSILDEIPGVGPKRKKALMNHFGSLENLRQADEKALLQVEGMNKKTAGAVLDYLGR